MMVEKIFLEKPHNIFIIDKQIDTKCRLVRREKERKKRNAEKKMCLDELPVTWLYLCSIRCA